MSMTSARRSARPCGVTMGIIVDEDGATRYACLECGFSDDVTLLSVPDGRPRGIES